MTNSTCNEKITSDTKSNYKWYAKVGIFVIVIVGVWGLFSIPVLVYHLQQIEKVKVKSIFLVCFKIIASIINDVPMYRKKLMNQIP